MKNNIKITESVYNSKDVPVYHRYILNGVEKEEWLQYDKNERHIRTMFEDGSWLCLEYDKYGDHVHNIYRDQNGNIEREEWFEYDGLSNHIHSIYSDGTEEWYEYDEYSICIRTIYSDGTECDGYEPRAYMK